MSNEPELVWSSEVPTLPGYYLFLGKVHHRSLSLRDYGDTLRPRVAHAGFYGSKKLSFTCGDFYPADADWAGLWAPLDNVIAAKEEQVQDRILDSVARSVVEESFRPHNRDDPEPRERYPDHLLHSTASEKEKDAMKRAVERALALELIEYTEDPPGRFTTVRRKRRP